MRILITFLFFLTACNVYSQLTEEELVSGALEQLEISPANVEDRFLKVQNFGEESLLVIPVISEEGEGFAVYDAYLALVENTGGRILSKYFGRNEWHSDAVYLSDIKIDPDFYSLGTSKEALGVRISYFGSSRVAPYSATELSLFLINDTRLNPVLKNHRVSYSSGENDGNCNGKFETRDKILTIADSTTNGYSDLIFKLAVEKSISTDDNCESQVVENSEETNILKFKNGSYN